VRIFFKRPSRREQRGWTEARARGGPKGPDTSPRRREAARREQARRDISKPNIIKKFDLKEG